MRQTDRPGQVSGPPWSPGHGVNPGPGLGCYQVESPAGGIPCLERRHLDLESARPGHCGHPLIWFDAEHLAAGRLELSPRNARPAADVYDLPPGGWLRGCHHRQRVVRSGALVATRVRSERLGHLFRLVGRPSRVAPSGCVPKRRLPPTITSSSQATGRCPTYASMAGTLASGGRGRLASAHRSTCLDRATAPRACWRRGPKKTPTRGRMIERVLATTPRARRSDTPAPGLRGTGGVPGNRREGFHNPTG
jgi:hypothetical protein